MTGPPSVVPNGPNFDIPLTIPAENILSSPIDPPVGPFSNHKTPVLQPVPLQGTVLSSPESVNGFQFSDDNETHNLN